MAWHAPSVHTASAATLRGCWQGRQAWLPPKHATQHSIARQGRRGAHSPTTMPAPPTTRIHTGTLDLELTQVHCHTA